MGGLLCIDYDTARIYRRSRRHGIFAKVYSLAEYVAHCTQEEMRGIQELEKN